MTDKKRMDNGDIRLRGEDLAKSGQTLVLATATASDAWAAPVFYVFEAWRFYFFSDRESRHVKEALSAGQAGATVFKDGGGWQFIQGLQMKGTVTPVTKNMEAARMLRKYFQRFPFTFDFFKSTDGLPDMNIFRKRFRVELYAYIPSKIIYLDNRLHFGFKAEIILTN